MPFDIVEAAVRFVFDHSLAAPDFAIVWHSGEPLVLPVEWYRQAFASALRGGAPAGTHIPLGADQRHAGERRMAQFFRGHSVRVGVSLGGPAWLYDFRRRTRSGKGTHARVMQGISSAPFLKGRSSSMRQIMG